MEIDRNTPIPLHIQLRQLMISRIESGIFNANEPLPSERELCDDFGVSRTTVRETLRHLEKEGFIYKVPGRGAFISTSPRMVIINVSLDGFSSDLQREGMIPSSTVIGFETITSPNEELMSVMHFAKDTPSCEIVKIERLRFRNEAPLALHTVYLNHRFCPRILDHNLAKESLFSILRHNYGLKLVHAEEQAYAALATPRELRLLKIEPPAAVLRSERTTYLDSGDVIEYSQATYCGESYRLNIQLNSRE